MKRPDIYYLVAGVLGLIAALFGAIGTPRVERMGDAAAVVNGAPIPREALARAVLALESDSRNEVTPARQAEVLERLIEEELLVQRGIELGLAETDFAARRALVQSVLQLALAEGAASDPSEAELRRFYRENAGFFAPAPRFAASAVFFRTGTAEARIQTARQALQRGARAAELGDSLAIPMPRGALSQAEWARFLGAEAAAMAARLSPGEVTEAAPASGGSFLVRVDGFAAAPAPPFAAMVEQVSSEWRRRADERAARAYIERLKRGAGIERRAPAS